MKLACLSQPVATKESLGRGSLIGISQSVLNLVSLGLDKNSFLAINHPTKATNKKTIIW